MAFKKGYIHSFVKALERFQYPVLQQKIFIEDI